MVSNGGAYFCRRLRLHPLVAAKIQTLQAGSRLQFALHPLAGFGGKCLRHGPGQFNGMLLQRVAQEADLPAIAAAPSAEEQMQPQTHAFGRRQRVVERLGLRPRGLAAAGRELRAAGLYFLEEIHVYRAEAAPPQ